MKNLYKGVRKKLSKDIKTMRKNRGISLRDLGEDFKEKDFGFMARLGEMDSIFLKNIAYLMENKYSLILVGELVGIMLHLLELFT